MKIYRKICGGGRSYENGTFYSLDPLSAAAPDGLYMEFVSEGEFDMPEGWKIQPANEDYETRFLTNEGTFLSAQQAVQRGLITPVF